MKALDNDQIQALLKPKPKKEIVSKKEQQRRRYPLPPQRGPYREYDDEMLCIISGYFTVDENNERIWKKTHGACGSSTYGKLQGKPCCGRHAVILMNEMLHEEGIT